MLSDGPMIKSFKSKAVERFWTKGDVRGLRPDHVAKVQMILTTLDRAGSLSDMKRPSFDFHSLKGNLAGRYAVKVKTNWRVTFSWDDEGPFAIDIDYEDYH